MHTHMRAHTQARMHTHSTCAHRHILMNTQTHKVHTYTRVLSRTHIHTHLCVKIEQHECCGLCRRDLVGVLKVVHRKLEIDELSAERWNRGSQATHGQLEDDLLTAGTMAATSTALQAHRVGQHQRGAIKSVVLGMRKGPLP